MFRQMFFLVVFLSPVSPSLGFLIVHSFEGIKRKNLRDVMAAYQLQRCKYLCMLIFRVVSPSLTKKVYILHIAGYNNKFGNMISAM